MLSWTANLLEFLKQGFFQGSDNGPTLFLIRRSSITYRLCEEELAKFKAFKIKLFTINHLRDYFQPSISMDDANLQVSNSLTIHRLKFSSSMKSKDYIMLSARWPVHKIVYLDRARHFPRQYISNFYESTIRPCSKSCCHICSGHQYYWSWPAL